MSSTRSNFFGIRSLLPSQMRVLGENAANAVVAMISRHERDLPAAPHYTLLEDRWVERPTVRVLPASAEAASVPTI